MELYLNDVYPYAQQISNYIEREIFQQKLKAGQKLLSITNLSKELNVSKHTIQLSYKILRKKELIVKKGNDFLEEKMGYLRLEIQNKIEKSVLNENSSLNTTKKDTSSHGIGHKSVKRTMQKVGGALKYYETGDLFCAEAVFPIK